MADFARGEELRRLRNARHLSQEEAAHQIGVSTKSVRSWEKGKPIRWDNAKRVARFYKVKAEALVSRELEDQPALEDIHAEQLDRIEEGIREILERLKEPDEGDTAIDTETDAQEHEQAAEDRGRRVDFGGRLRIASWTAFAHAISTSASCCSSSTDHLRVAAPTPRWNL